VTSGDLVLTSELSNLEKNPELDAGVFEMDLPDDVEIEER
jgi:outer membrane lipoprotein-sorting protein